MSDEKDTQMVCNVMGEVLARIDEMVREEGEHEYQLDFDRILSRVRRAVDDARLWWAHERQVAKDWRVPDCTPCAVPVSEQSVPQPPVVTPAPPEFKVGDRVRVVNTSGHNIQSVIHTIGSTGTVCNKRNRDGEILVDIVDGETWYYFAHNLEHVPT